MNGFVYWRYGDWTSMTHFARKIVNGWLVRTACGKEPIRRNCTFDIKGSICRACLSSRRAEGVDR